MIASAAEFHRLRTNENPEEYRRAAHEEASEEVWREVILQYPDMRSWVAHNKTVPIGILRLLASDADPKVRYEVASKRKLDAQLFDQLARDADEDVRCKLARNAKLPNHLRERLSRDSAPLVAQAALERLRS